MSQRVTTDVTIGRIKGDITYLPVCHSVYQYKNSCHKKNRIRQEVETDVTNGKKRRRKS